MRLASLVLFGTLLSLSLTLTSSISIAQEHSEQVQYHPQQPKKLSEVHAAGRVNIYQEFPIVLVVNKSPRGMFAQTAQLWENGKRTAQFAISTGRERWENPPSGEKYFSETPAGWFQPQFFDRNYYSRTWQLYMEFSVFFNGGIALHATEPAHYAQLGRRGSGGCVRMTKPRAESIFNLIQKAGKGNVPAITPEGKILRDSSGNIIRRYGWNTLIIIEE